MATVREFGETNPTQERSTSGGGLRCKRLKRPAVVSRRLLGVVPAYAGTQ